MSAKSITTYFLRLALPLGLLVTLIVLMRSPVLIGNDALSLAITLDLLLTVPLVYFFLIRKSRIPKTTVVPAMIAGLLIGSYCLPKESQVYLELFKFWVLPVIELTILTFVLLKVRKAVKTFRQQQGTTTDFYDALKRTCREVLPEKLVLPFATEVAVFYYGFINWKRRPLATNEFTYHKTSGTPALLAAFMFMIAIETVALHILLVKWSPLVAWMLTILSAYTAVQVLAIAKSLSQRPVAMDAKELTLRYGMLNEAHIHPAEIEEVTRSSTGLKKEKLTRTLSPLGELESYNVIIRLKKEHTLTGLYGLKKQFKVIGLHVDEPQVFVEQLEEVMRNAKV